MGIKAGNPQLLHDETIAPPRLILKFKIAVGFVIVVVILVGAGLVGLDLLAQEWDAGMESAKQVCAGYACCLPFFGAVVAFVAWHMGRRATTSVCGGGM